MIPRPITKAQSRIVQSGRNRRVEYLSANLSPLYSALPSGDFAAIQKKSYKNFIENRLPKLFTDYFPAKFSDYNNTINIDIKDVKCEETGETEDEARENSQTWNNLVTFIWSISWDCQRMQIPLLEEGLEVSIRNWVNEGFKIGDFSLEKISDKEWEIVEKDGLRMIVRILDSENEENLDNLLISFSCNNAKRIKFCHLPRINKSGDFIINGHDKVVVFQSVRAPSLHNFFNEEKGYYSEIIPLKGPWINISKNQKKSSVELKFLNSGLVIDFFQILKTFSLTKDDLEKLFDLSDLDLSNYSQKVNLEKGITLPQFIFNKKNSYFKIGRLGRKKFNAVLDILKIAKNQTLAEDIFNQKNELILAQGLILNEDNIAKLKDLFLSENLNRVDLPESEDPLFSLRIKSPVHEGKVIKILGFCGEITEKKTFFDLADLAAIVSNCLNLEHKLVKIESENHRDKLNNQVIRTIGDLIYNIFDNKLGGFLQDIENKYLSYISQLKNRVNLFKISYLAEIENSIRNFFNSVLSQLQNQNNPLSSESYRQKTTLFGRSGYDSQKKTVTNVTMKTRDTDDTYIGRYDVAGTQEGPKVGLIHYLTLVSRIDDYGQIVTPCYVVKNGFVTPKIVYLNSEDEQEFYVTHAGIRIGENNQILDETVHAFFRGKIVEVSREKVNFIHSSYSQLNSSATASIPIYSHNDATRVLMAANMQRQAIPPLFNEEPLIASGIEAALSENAALTVKADEDGVVTYVDVERIIVLNSNGTKSKYSLKQAVLSNKNILNFSRPLVKTNQKICSGEIIAEGSYSKNGELALGANARVAYMCFKGRNFEDGIVMSRRFADKFPYFHGKSYTIFVRNTKQGPEVLTNNLPNFDKEKLLHLDENGIVKIGTEVKGGDVLAGKLTPQVSQNQEDEEEFLLMSILGEKSQKMKDNSLRLPTWEDGVVYKIKEKTSKVKNELRIIEIFVGKLRRVQEGDKFSTYYGSKGVVTNILPNSDMPYDKDGKIVDLVLNPLSLPSRMNFGQIAEAVLGNAAEKMKIKMIFRPFNLPNSEIYESVFAEAGIKDQSSEILYDGETGSPFDKKVLTGRNYIYMPNHKVEDKIHSRNTGAYSAINQGPLKGRKKGGGLRNGEMEVSNFQSHGAFRTIASMFGVKSDDILGRRDLINFLLFGNKEGTINLNSGNYESFNVLRHYLLVCGFDITGYDQDDKEISFYANYTRARKNSFAWIKKLRLSLLDPEKIREKYSFGAVVNHKMVNTRNLKPEPGGLLDPAIFGPYNDYECHCLRYRGREHKGKICEKCGTLLAERIIQRWRPGHIELPFRVVNTIFFQNNSTILSKIFNISARDMENVIRYNSYIVVDSGLSSIIKVKDIIERKPDYQFIKKLLEEIIERSENQDLVVRAEKMINKLEEQNEFENDNVFIWDYLKFLEENWKVKIETGSEALYKIFSEFDLDAELNKIKETEGDKLKKNRNDKYRFLSYIKFNNVNLLHMFSDKLVVLPAGLRPVIKIENGTIVTTKINDLYRRICLIVLRISNYLEINKKALIYLPEIMNEEKRRLQSAIDKLTCGDKKK